jgi:chemotaxis protein methyltransferase WspC
MSFSTIKELLYQSIGLHADTVGNSSIDRAISHRMRETNSQTSDAYCRVLENNNEELNELIEEVVVPETWFFRNLTPFEVLRENALKMHASLSRAQSTGGENKAESGGNSLRILSIPCSTGEEPYSLAMVLSEAGLKQNDFVIDAFDVSKRALRKARRAIYGKHSFREKGLNLQEKYFEKVHSGFRLSSTVQDCVSFKQGNILVDPISPSAAYYDIVFCRNLLIYFDRETQRRILEKLSAMLKNGGLLFVGHAETGQIDKTLFTKIRTSKAFAFRKKSFEEPVMPLINTEDQPVDKLKGIYDQLVEVTNRDIALSKKINKPKSYSAKKKKKTTIEDNVFKKVNSLINTGHLLDASKVCEEYLKKDPENSEAYYYLGFICNLQGGAGGAESLLRKAIYLSPNNHKALALSAILAEQRGDKEEANAFRRREKKARERKL